jgi:hypothetical protein
MNESLIKRMQWLLQQEQPDDLSVYNMMYDEYKDLEKRLMVELPEHKATHDDIRKHRDMNKVLANWPPFKVREYDIVELAMEDFF